MDFEHVSQAIKGEEQALQHISAQLARLRSERGQDKNPRIDVLLRQAKEINARISALRETRIKRTEKDFGASHIFSTDLPHQRRRRR